MVFSNLVLILNDENEARKTHYININNSVQGTPNEPNNFHANERLCKYISYKELFTFETNMRANSAFILFSSLEMPKVKFSVSKQKG